MAAVGVAFAVTGPIGEIIAGIRPFRSRFTGTRVEGLPDEERPSITERLANHDELSADGVVTGQEHAAQRAHPRRVVDRAGTSFVR